MTNTTTSPDGVPVPVPAPGPEAEGPRSPVPAGPTHIRLDRRMFLALAGGAGAVGMLGAALGPRAWEVVFGGASDRAGALSAGTAKRLVLVTLYGGNDGLNTVVPYQDPAYAASRGALAVDPSTVLPIGEGFGLHPALTGLRKLWDAKKLAIVQGVGFPDPNYSHFESMDIWQSGSTTSSTTTGWIGRWLDRNGSSPLRAVGIGPTTPVVLQGERVQGASLPSGPIQLPGSTQEQSLFAQLAGTTKSEAGLVMEVARSNADLITVEQRLGPILARSATSDPLHLSPATAASGPPAALAIANGGGGVSSAGVLATQLSMVANLILAGSPTEVYSVELGGFDTHANQSPTQQTLLSELDKGVSGFVDALGADPAGQGTVVVVYTEFGRRIVGNASAGSDHGWANVVFVAGHGVRGGWYGEPPSLTKLSDGNLVFTTDFRSVYASVLAAVLGTDPSDALAGRFRTLPFV